MKVKTILWALALAPATFLLAETAEPYPLETCVISGAKLDSMGGPHIHDHEGTEVRFCCRACLPRFNRDPAKYLKMIEDAREEAPKPSED